MYKLWRNSLHLTIVAIKGQKFLARTKLLNSEKWVALSTTKPLNLVNAFQPRNKLKMKDFKKMKIKVDRRSRKLLTTAISTQLVYDRTEGYNGASNLGFNEENCRFIFFILIGK
ncbi:unnamed protein product [Rodentolepis nana]|uniref:Uncharacterized protein n=1 Tax=Rodentolepis nana TaxID=102285 RepID=A0A0R3TCT7_RODNA|nr:unnamed protein product [Rodentolepis nana]